MRIANFNRLKFLECPRGKGFSLIELMIVLAIVAILASLAYPSYQRYVIRAQRHEAKAALQGLAQSMEKQYAQNNTYAGLAAGGANVGAPAFFATQSPLDGGPKTYNLQINATATTYTLTATPIAGTTQANDGALQLLSTGQRGWDSNHDGAFSASENTWPDH